MRLLVDENIPYAREFFSSSAELKFIPSNAFTQELAQEADGLLVRSVTQVNAALLTNTPVKFVGTATIGIDHLDTNWLAQAGITFTNAPGCNADSVVDYVLASLLLFAQTHNLILAEQTIGVVGVGQVGGRLAQRLQNFGCQVLLNDPPLQEQGKQGLISLHEVLNQADIVCLHTPLTKNTAHPSLNLISTTELEILRGKLLLNAGRGKVIDAQALNKHLNSANPVKLILDVFPQEPDLNLSLIQHCFLATPHIAGYSLDGKAKGTWQLYQAWCEFLGTQPNLQLADFLPAPAISQLHLSPQLSPQEACWQASQAIYQPSQDAWRLIQALANQPHQGTQVYQELRKNYPVRREFACLNVKVSCTKQASALKALGFAVN